MPDDYGSMVTRITDEVDDSALTTQIQAAIQTAIKFYERKPFYFNSKILSFNTVGNQEYYGAADAADIPTLTHIESLVITLTGVKMPVAPVLFDWIDDAQTGQSVGLPYAYAYYTQQIRFFPIPPAAYAVLAAIRYRFAALALPTDTNAWMTDGEEMIRQRAKIILNADVIQGDGAIQAITLAKAMEADAYKALMQETRTRMADAPLYTEIANLVSDRTNFNIFRGS